MKALLTFLFSIVLLAGTTAAIVVPADAQAARVGGGRSFGTQRAAPPRATPAPQQAPQQSKQAAPAAQPATPPAGNRWMGPLAGLAAGLGLGWLLSQGGFGGALAGILMALLAGVAIFAVLRLLMRNRAPAARRPLTEPPFAAAGPQSAMADALEPQLPRSSGSPALAPAARGEAPRLESQIVLPEGFDADGFIRQAKLNFIRLQAANDERDLGTLREVTTAEMYDALVADLPPKAGAQHTDVVNLDASLLEVSTEGERHWVSVRFHGTIREDQRPAAPFEEVWHLQKPVSGETGWLLAGIQQVS